METPIKANNGSAANSTDTATKKLQQQLEKNMIRETTAWGKYRELGGYDVADESAEQTRARLSAEKWGERVQNVRREIQASAEVKAEKKAMRRIKY